MMDYKHISLNVASLKHYGLMKGHRAHSYNPVFQFSVFHVCTYKVFQKDLFATYPLP